MSDPKVIRELDAQLACDRKALTDLSKRESELLSHVSHKGFCAEVERNRLLYEMQALRNSIKKKEQILAMTKR
jgi:hypothetical protein